MNIEAKKANAEKKALNSVTKQQKTQAKVLKVIKRQIGDTNKKMDKLKDAMRPGKRISKNGNVYYEFRKNRSDLRKRV